jgi:hypothetical protein
MFGIELRGVQKIRTRCRLFPGRAFISPRLVRASARCKIAGRCSSTIYVMSLARNFRSLDMTFSIRKSYTRATLALVASSNPQLVNVRLRSMPEQRARTERERP